MELKDRHIYAIDLALVAGTLIVIIGLLGYAQPLVIAPIDELSTLNSSVLFEFEKAEVILIDDNIDFSSPDEIYAKDNLVINLKPGKYYWKVSGTFESEIRTLTILSNVDLKLKEKEDKYEIVNSGNERLNVDVYRNSTLIGNVILERDESSVEKADKFIGRQDEK